MQVVTLSNGVEMPILGLGLSHNGGYSEVAVVHAAKTGVRLYDTAARYDNEDRVSKALFQVAKVKREEIFLTTKLWPGQCHNVREAFMSSMRRLGVSYLDLYLIHWPDCGAGSRNSELRLRVWRELESLYEEGLCKSIGVSNFMINHLEALLPHCKIKPHVNQIEYNPLQNPRKLVDYCQANGIVVEGYCPLAKNQALRHPVIVAIANKYGKTAAQILIRWSVQHNVVTIPKSTKPSRIDENMDIWGLVLSEADMQILDGLHVDLRVTWDPTDIP